MATGLNITDGWNVLIRGDVPVTSVPTAHVDTLGQVT